jgi:hypothetical protein
MGQVNLKIDDKLEKEFRMIAAEKFGGKRGFLKKGIEEPLQDWVSKNQRGFQNG